MSNRINRSKYNFSKLGMGGTMTISPLDLYSMKNSLRFYNKQHKQNIIVSTEEIVDPASNGVTEILVTRVPAKIKVKK